MIQNREFDVAKSELLDQVKHFNQDPYARLSAGYFLIDVDKDGEIARKMLTEFMDAQALDNDIQFRQAVQETRRVASPDAGLPSIE